jgi:hypothetical protein
LRLQRDKDIKIQIIEPIYTSCYNACGSYTTSYDIAIYRNKGCGVSEWLNLCEDEYEDDDNVVYDDKFNYAYSTTKSIYYEQNIKKCINNCKQTDKKKLNWNGKCKLTHIGNIDYEYIDNLLKEQNYKCYLCGDKVFTYLYIPYCSYKFSIDRINNDEPHDKGNVKISCYFCNCKDHIAYGKNTKEKCDDKTCFCHNDEIKCIINK